MSNDKPGVHYEDYAEACGEPWAEVTGNPKLVSCGSCQLRLVPQPQQVTDTDILTWLQGRCIFLDVVSDEGQDTTVWHAEDGMSIADSIIRYCDQNNINLLEEIRSGCVETPSENHS